MGGDLIRAGQFGVSHYLGWNPNEPDWRSRLGREVSLGDKSNWEIFVEHEKENLVRGVCLIGGKVAGDSLGKAFRWLRNRGSVAQKGLPIPQVTDPKLKNLVTDLYRGAKGPNPIGNGSTADAVRNELLTGLPTHGRFHFQKAQEYANALTKWLQKNPNASHHDKLVAQSLLDDLNAALKGK